LLLVAATATACHGRASAGAVDGAKVFAGTCAVCHGASGKPDEQMVARLGVRDLTAPEFRARVTPELVEKQVRGGSKNKLMPAFAGALSEEQIKAVAAYVAGKTFVQPGQ
jgi:mono/diheme cytochrome c family protein